jgi:hypothetical protein
MSREDRWRLQVVVVMLLTAIFFTILFSSCQKPVSTSTEVRSHPEMSGRELLSSYLTNDLCVVNGEPRIYDFGYLTNSMNVYEATYMKMDGDVVYRTFRLAEGQLNMTEEILITSAGVCP